MRGSSEGSAAIQPPIQGSHCAPVLRGMGGWAAAFVLAPGVSPGSAWKITPSPFRGGTSLRQSTGLQLAEEILRRCVLQCQDVNMAERNITAYLYENKRDLVPFRANVHALKCAII
jgi:hypothetical protein